MPASISRPLGQAARLRLGQAGPLGRLWWLPANGQGNGLDDAAWAQIIEVGADAVAPLLAAFRARGIPAYAAPAPRSTRRRGFRGPAGPRFRLWAGASAYGRAEEALLTLLAGRRGGDADARG
jgi:hypothetical protein